MGEKSDEAGKDKLDGAEDKSDGDKSDETEEDKDEKEKKGEATEEGKCFIFKSHGKFSGLILNSGF